jgi:ABC-2 type transport system ATP-binding protein
MIMANNLSKSFNKIKALQNVTAQIKEGSIFGLIGSNGAGKSTFLRLVAGIYKADGGQIQVDGQDIFENTAKKQEMFYISDDQFFFANSSMNDMRDYYKKVYNRFSDEKFKELSASFKLDPKRRLNTFSKGMQKQAFIILALSCQPKYLLCDETFDGLDPVMRQAVKRIFADEVSRNHMTPVIASHNLRELEDICDHVGLLHQGGIIFEREIDDLVQNIYKIQCVFATPVEKEELDDMDIITFEKKGSLCTFTARGEREDILAALNSRQMVFSEILPLSLEEIFICEMEGLGYDIDKIIL